MACVQIATGISQDCQSSMGGVKAIYLTNHDLSDVTVDSNGVVTLTANDFYRFNTRKNVSTMTSTFNIDSANGTNYVSTELALTFARMDVEKRVTINALRSAELMGVVIDNNGNGWFLGYDNPITVTSGGAQTGAAVGDGNNYTVTITDESKDLPYAVKPEIVEALLQIK